MKHTDALKVFVEVVRQGSFAEASRTLNLPTTTVSRKIKLLEEELGLLLLHRTTRSQTLTEAGEGLLPKAEAVLASLQELMDDISDNAHSPKGMLSISGPATVLREYTPVFARFLRKYPDISLRFEGSSRYQNLIDDRLDFAFRVGPLTDSSIIARRVQTMRNYLVASPSFLSGKTLPKHPLELSNWPSIRSHINGYEAPWVFSSENGENLQVHPNNYVVSDDLSFCLNMAIEGMGVAYLSDHLIDRYLEDQSLVALTFGEWEPVSRDVFLVYQEKSYLPPKSRAFIEFFSNSKNY
ncbi:MAG: LysR family transcriptional regulator [Cognatishimia sp.]|uniref:LysR family transcriptional regulator n=1 Tax=Cognatishimia sp. TaxID=2211648 RepID=UPI003B8ABE84